MSLSNDEHAKLVASVAIHELRQRRPDAGPASARLAAHKAVVGVLGETVARSVGLTVVDILRDPPIFSTAADREAEAAKEAARPAWQHSENPYERTVGWLSERYGDTRGRFLANRLSRMIRRVNDSCMDNFRVARLDRAAEVEAYDAAKAGGCCGSIDKVFEFRTQILGRIERYSVGFNFGH